VPLSAPPELIDKPEGNSDADHEYPPEPPVAVKVIGPYGTPTVPGGSEAGPVTDGAVEMLPMKRFGILEGGVRLSLPVIVKSYAPAVVGAPLTVIELVVVVGARPAGSAVVVNV